MTAVPTTEQTRRDRVRAVAKAEALIEAACEIGGPAAVALNHRAETYLQQAARLHPLIPSPDTAPAGDEGTP